MKIASMHIQKFRSINDMKITFEQILAVVGANNSGKSHILRALNAFFNYSKEKEAFARQDHMYSIRSKTIITVTFTDIRTEDQIDPKYIDNKTLTLQFVYPWRKKRKISYSIIKSNAKYVSINMDEFESIISHFRYIYVPIARSYENAISENGGIVFSLLQEIFQHQTANRNTIKPLVDNLIRKIEKNIFKPAIADIQKYYPLGSADFLMKTADPEVIELILRSVSLSLIENGQHNKISNCGNGIQSAVYFAIEMARSMEGNINYLIGVEEPELNMHPQAQRQLIESLKNKEKYPNVQFIVTTHSTVIIDKLGHSSIVLCRKHRGDSREIVTEATQLPMNFLEKYDLTKEKYEAFYRYKNSDFFFSNYIIMTESPNDNMIVSALLRKSNIDIEDESISFICMDGEKNIKYPYVLAKELGIPFLCIVDRDVFQPYRDDQRKNSLDNKGIPQYRPCLKTSSPIYDLVEKNIAQQVVDAFTNDNYEKVLGILKPYRIITMRYAIEVDLILCKSYRNIIGEEFHLPQEKRTTAYLLKERNKHIKDDDIIIPAINSQSTRNLPRSYRQIVSCTKEMIAEA